jgi:hypothetical protein
VWHGLVTVPRRPRRVQEIKRIQSVPLVIGQFLEMIDANYGIVSSTAGSTYHVRILSTLDREKLKPNTSIALHRHSHSVVEILPPEADSSIQTMQMHERPTVTYEVRRRAARRDVAVGCLTVCVRVRVRARALEPPHRTLAAWTFRSRRCARRWSCR